MKTKAKNLQLAFKHIDDACGSLNNALDALGSITSGGANVEKVINELNICFQDVISLKNDIESLQKK